MPASWYVIRAVHVLAVNVAIEIEIAQNDPVVVKFVIPLPILDSPTQLGGSRRKRR